MLAVQRRRLLQCVDLYFFMIYIVVTGPPPPFIGWFYGPHHRLREGTYGGRSGSDLSRRPFDCERQGDFSRVCRTCSYSAQLLHSVPPGVGGIHCATLGISSWPQRRRRSPPRHAWCRSAGQKHRKKAFADLFLCFLLFCRSLLQRLRVASHLSGKPAQKR